MIESNLPLVTIIVPCYNHEQYVEKCIDSIFRQTYPNIEVIVVDDVSSDSSVAIIKQLQQKYNFKFIEHKENIGLSRTLNEVIFNYAHGKYIKSIASDDYLPEDCISVLTSEIEKYHDKYSLVYGTAQDYCINAEGQIQMLSIRGSKSSYEDILFGLGNMGIPASSVLFRKDLCIKVGGFKVDSHIEDQDLWLKLSKNYEMLFIDKVVSYYQVDSNVSSLSKNIPKMYISYVGIIADGFARMDDISYDTALKLFDLLDYRRFHFIIYSLENYLKSDTSEAVKIYFKYFTTLLTRKSKYVFVFWPKLIKSIFCK